MQTRTYSIAVAMANLKLLLKGSNLRISYDQKEKLFSIKDKEKVHFFGNLVRGHRLYQRGLKKRAEDIFKSYLLKHIHFEDNDIVVDCGANYGDLWLSLEGKINKTSYITFEPGILESKSTKLNAPGGVHNRLGLSNRVGNSRFYVNEEDADSSLIEPFNFTHYVDVVTTTLSNYVKSNNIKNIKLFKVEAEGFEPEILEGAKEVLHLINYIAIDGGYERGKNNDQTFSKTCNFLLRNNFEMVSINFKWSRALFVNKRF